MRSSKTLLFTLWSAALILCVAVSIFALLFSACAGPKEAKQEVKTGFTVETDVPEDPATTAESQAEQPQETEPVSESEPPQNSPVPTTEPVRLGETPDAGREYLDRIIFLGDSTTYGIGAYYDWGYTDLCPPSQVWTPASGTLTLSYYNIATIVYPQTKEELTIVDAVTRAKPDIMVITLGVNGISFMDEEWFIRDYTALVESIQAASPETKIILNSIYPVAASYKYQGDINNEKIRAANIWIERIAEATGCRFLYSFECLVGTDGNLPESSQNGDGLHLTGEAFGVVMQYIRTHAIQ